MLDFGTWLFCSNGTGSDTRSISFVDFLLRWNLLQIFFRNSLSARRNRMSKIPIVLHIDTVTSAVRDKDMFDSAVMRARMSLQKRACENSPFLYEIAMAIHAGSIKLSDQIAIRIRTWLFGRRIPDVARHQIEREENIEEV